MTWTYLRSLAAAAAAAPLFAALAGCAGGDALAADVAAASASADAAASGIAGTWQLNRDLSDQPPRPPAGEGPGAGQQPPPPPDGAQPPPPPDGQNPPAADSTRPAPRLTITVAAGSVTLSRDGRHGRTLYTDGRTTSDTLPDGKVVTTTAHWEGSVLVVERSGPKGTATERFAASDGDKRLTQTTTLPVPTPDGKTALTMVFDRVS
jgi:hypothetical protein